MNDRLLNIKEKLKIIDEKLLNKDISKEEEEKLKKEKEKFFEEIINIGEKYKEIHKNIEIKIEKSKKEKEITENKIEEEIEKINESMVEKLKEPKEKGEIYEEKYIEKEETKEEEAYTEEEIKNDISIEYKNQTMSKNKKQLLLVGIITLILLGGVLIYKNLPSNKVETKEEIILADPDNFRLEDIKLEEKEEEVVIETKIEEPNLEIEKVNKKIIENNDDEKINEDSAEIDAAIRDLENKNFDERELRENRRSEISFYRKAKDIERNINENSNFNFNPVVPNANNFTTGEKKESYKEEKENFIKSEKDIMFINKFTLKGSIINEELKVGSIIPAILLTEINTNLPGNILAQTREDIYDSVTGRILLIPKGSKLYGKYDSAITKGQTKILIVFTRLMLPNGETITLENMQGLDLLGNAGLEDRIDKHRWELFGNAVLASVLNLGNNLSKSVKFNIGGNSFGLAGNIIESKNPNNISPFETATGKLLENSVNIEPTLSIRRGFKFNILVSKDLLLKEYK